MDILEMKLRDKEIEIGMLTEELLEIGEGSLNLNHRAGKHYYIENNNGRQKGISRNIERVYQLARKEYLKKHLAVLEKELKMLKMDESRTALCETKKLDIDEKIIKKYNRLDYARIIYSEKEYEWYQNRQSQNPYMREHLIYSTENGTFMRSKSERFIGDFLERKGRLYRYEPLIHIEDRAIYPDFMVRRSNGEIVIWEHLGLMNNAEYADRAMRRLQDYRRIGYVQHRNLICTYEEDLRNKDVLEEIYHRFL